MCAIIADLVCWGVPILAKRLRGWTRDEDGTTSVEYALILAVVVITSMSAVMALHASLVAPVNAANQMVGDSLNPPGGAITYEVLH
jgi:Flp pilus assembly pilin Flp